MANETDGRSSPPLLDDDVQNQVEGSDIAKVALASAIGTMIEFYDFFIYSIATALVFNKIFFPPPQQNLWADSGSGRRPNV
jgi:hypothetical protein